jgi:hypothetical protein
LISNVLQLLDAQGITLSNCISYFPEALIAGPNLCRFELKVSRLRSKMQ